VSDEPAADGFDELVEMAGVDVRTVTIIWTSDDDVPEIEWSGCSSYEAEGLCQAAGRWFARVNYIPDDDDDDDDDDED